MNSRISVFVFFSPTLSWMHIEQWNWHYFLLHWRAFSSHYYQQSTRFSLSENEVCYYIRAISPKFSGYIYILNNNSEFVFMVKGVKFLKNHKNKTAVLLRT